MKKCPICNQLFENEEKCPYCNCLTCDVEEKHQDEKKQSADLTNKK